jgi:hypothetical protein
MPTSPALACSVCQQPGVTATELFRPGSAAPLKGDQTIVVNKNSYGGPPGIGFDLRFDAVIERYPQLYTL